MIKAHPLLHEVEAYQVAEYDSVDLTCVGVRGARRVCVPTDQGTLRCLHSGSLASLEMLFHYLLVFKSTLSRWVRRQL